MVREFGELDGVAVLFSSSKWFIKMTNKKDNCLWIGMVGDQGSFLSMTYNASTVLRETTGA